MTTIFPAKKQPKFGPRTFCSLLKKRVLKVGFQKVMLLIIVQMWFIDDLPEFPRENADTMGTVTYTGLGVPETRGGFLRVDLEETQRGFDSRFKPHPQYFNQYCIWILSDISLAIWIHFKNMLPKLDPFPKVRDENTQKSLKVSPSWNSDRIINSWGILGLLLACPGTEVRKNG